MIVDVHRHVIVEEMTAPEVPEHWRPAFRRENGRYRLTFRGRSDRPFDMGTEHPVEEVRALGLGAAEELVLGGNAGRLLGVPDG